MYKYKSFTLVSNQCKFSLLKALVDRLTGEEARDVLKEISKKMPFLVLDVADKLQAGPQYNAPGRLSGLVYLHTVQTHVDSAAACVLWYAPRTVP